MNDQAPTVDRRRLLAVLGTGAAAGFAGCLGEDETSGEDGESDGDDTSEVEDLDNRMIDHPGDEPITFEDDHHCIVCNMRPTNFSAWQGQLAHETDVGAVFCTPGCMSAYVAEPTHFDGADTDIVGAWTTEYRSGEQIDATEASFVIVTDEDGAPDDPMELNPRVFADHDDAVSFLETWDAEELTEDDIITFDEIDREVGSIYRGDRL